MVSLEEAVGQLAAGHVPFEPTVVLTFDDAYENFYTHVFPLLQEHNLPATLYVPVYFIEGKAPPPIAGTEGLSACSWAQLRAMQASGLVTIGAHTCTHPRLPAVSRTRARWEIEASKALLEEEMGARVTSFCYPRALWSRPLEEVVMRAYETAVVGGGVKQRPGAYHPYRLQRVSIRRDAPHDLKPVLESSVWLEEWTADWVRHLKARSGSRR